MATSNRSRLVDVLTEDLVLERWQIEPRSGASLSESNLEDKYFEVDCLVHDNWLNAAVSSDIPLPSHPPTFSPEMVHWMLQPSCATEPEPPWHRIHISCFMKPNVNDYSPLCVQRFLVPRNDFSIDSLHTFLTTVAQETTLTSWRKLAEQIDAEKNDFENIRCSPPLLTSTFMNQLVFEVYGKEMRPVIPNESNRSTPPQKSRHSPSSQDSMTTSNHVGCGKESLSPLIAAMESETAFYFVYSYHRFTLFDCIIHSPAILDNSTGRPLFIIYQLLKMVSYCHSKGITLGDINLKNIYIDGRLWIQYYLPSSALCTSDNRTIDADSERSSTATPTPSDPIATSSQEEMRHHPLSDYIPPSLTLSDAVMKWRLGELSNFDYIMLLNYYVGRRIGDPNNHPIFPWITDFTQKNGQLRDLSSSKHRLAKGDYQLDFTYRSALQDVRRSSFLLGGVIPHHIGDIASDVTYYVYTARQTPKEVLCSRVRPRWVPEEYPATIIKMYEWTPDESIPEFYTCPEIFYSIHSDLPDLGVPDWCSSPEEFISLHRNLLESDTISSELHHWFDLMFGYKLAGDAAVKAKNVYLSLVDGHTSPTSSGIVQLFRSSHPKRVQNCSAPLVIFQWQHYLNMSSLMSLTAFNISQTLTRRKPSQPALTLQEEETKEKTLASILDQGYMRSGAYIRTPDKRTQLDDGSFEHVGYPNDTDDPSFTMTMGVSASYADDNYDLSMLTPSSRRPSTKQQDIAVLSEGTGGGKRGILRGILRPRPTVTTEAVDTFEWQGTNITIPNDTSPLQPLIQVEEAAHFLAKSCRDFGDLCTQQWMSDDLLMLQHKKQDRSIHSRLVKLLKEEDKGLYHSFEERVILDLAAVTCVALEITCNKYLRGALPLKTTLSERFKILNKLISNGQLHVPFHLCCLTDQIFREGEAIIPSIIPSFSAAALIQQFIPLVSFPKYFELLYQTLSDYENKSKGAGLATPPIRPKLVSTFTREGSNNNDKNPSEVISFIASHLSTILPQLDRDGLQLFMLYVFPLFEHPSSCFEALFSLFDPLSQYLGRKWIQQTMIPSFLYAFDTFENPSNRCRILSRSTADMLISQFGLAIFLNRFLSCIIDATIEPLAQKMSSKKQKKSDFLSSTKEGEASKIASVKNISLSQIANTLSPTRSSSKLSLSFSWENHTYESDSEGEDSDAEADLSFPEASILASKLPFSSVFGLLADMEHSTNINEQGLSSESAETKLTAKEPSPKPDPPLHEMGGNTTPTQPFDSSIIESMHTKEESPITPSLTVDNIPSPDRSNTFQLSTDECINLSLDDPLLPPSTDTTKEPLSTLPILSSVESLEEKEGEDVMLGEGEGEGDIETPVDPKFLTISAHISEVSSDCLIWLIWRLGPVLATKHIAHPLLDNMYKCFSGVCKANENNNTRYVLSVLSAMIEYYGDKIVSYLYIPFIKKQVAFLNKRTSISVKVEANIAASVAILEMSVNKTNNAELLLKIMDDISRSYFKPLFKVLSSKIIVFPNGTEARATICHSTVQLLKEICRKLGRIRSSEVLMDALQSFFNCFSTAHGKEKPVSGLLTPVEGFYGSENGRFTDNIPSVKTPGDENPMAVEQVMRTFLPEMVHNAYVDFCKLIGQISLTNNLHNIDVIEDLHASYSQETEGNTVGQMTSLLGLTEEEESSDSSSPNSSDSSTDLNLAYELGPTMALQGRSGLGPDSTSFGESSWFVDTEETDLGGGGGQEEKSSTTQAVSSGSSFVSVLRNTLTVSTAPLQFKTQTDTGGVVGAIGSVENTDSALNRGSALFDAKFGAPTSDGINTISSETFIGLDCTLKGSWAEFWRRYVDHGPQMYEVYTKLDGVKLQSYVGHKSAIKCLHVQDSEHIFLSGSKDKTVKIWSSHNQGDGTAMCQCKQTFAAHQRTVLNIGMINKSQAVSCDGSVHVWDLQTSYSLHHFSSPTTPFLAMEILKHSPSTLVVATADFQLRFIDVRTQGFQHVWKTHFQTGSIRFLAPSFNWIAVGNINGTLNMLDIRTGEILHHWKPADKWPLPVSTWGDSLTQVKVTERGNLLTSAGPGLISLWKPNSRPLNHFRGQTSSTPCLESFGEELVTISNNGQVVVHGSYEFVRDRDNIVSMTKIKSKEIRGNLTCSAALQQNQLLLLGSETGQLVLMA